MLGLVWLLLGACGEGGPGASDAAVLDLSEVRDLAVAVGDAASPPDLAAPDLVIEAPDLVPGGTRVRLVAANLSSGNRQAYEAPGLRILQGLRADVALLQEWNYGTSSPAELRAFVDMAFGAEFTWFRESGNGIAIPNAVVSRYPILASGSWDDPTLTNRDFAWARIDVPGPRDLWAVSVHLPTADADRPRSAAALVAAIAGNVPAGDLLVLGGDWNTNTRNEAAVTTLGAVGGVAAPWPADQSGNSNTSGPRTRPYDWLILDADLAPLETAVQIRQSSYASGLVFDSRVYTPIADVAPALSGDSGAAGMQHMAVVRDVLLEP